MRWGGDHLPDGRGKGKGARSLGPKGPGKKRRKKVSGRRLGKTREKGGGLMLHGRKVLEAGIETLAGSIAARQRFWTLGRGPFHRGGVRA